MIKKIIAVCILVGLILSVTGCKKEKAAVEEKTNIKPKTVTEETISVAETVTESELLPEQEVIEQKTEKVPVEKAEIASSDTSAIIPKQENPKKWELQFLDKENPEKWELQFLDKENPEKWELQFLDKENSENWELQFLDKEKVEEIKVVPEAPALVTATAEDGEEIAEKILGYINSYRTIKAIKLEGLTEYAEYRSRQLIRRFAHNTEDERAAATALQYGEYVDPSLYGMNGAPYYTSCSREAIAKAGYAGTVDEIAQRFANLIKTSASHWAYVGADEYSYIGVGVTYESGMWYCDVAVSLDNTDNK